MQKAAGRVTLPAEVGQEEVVKHLIEQWGVDAIRDSDGTTLSDEILEMDFPIYSTICLVRAEQSWPREHPEDLPQAFLMTPRQTYVGEPLEFDLMRDWFPEKYRMNEDDDPKEWWDVIDRTSGEFLSCGSWEYKDGIVTLKDAEPYHEYTVNFLVYQTWDSTSMYNALTNNWTGDKTMCVDPFVPAVYNHLMDYFDQWLENHPQTNVVRLTTLAFSFMMLRDTKQRDVVRDWCGYCETVTPDALRAFEKEKGYRLRGEDFIQAGQYAHTTLPPTEKMLDWMDFIQSFVLKFGKELVDKVHAAGKEAAFFWGDHWIGAEPFDPRFAEMGLDVMVGAAEDGTALRRVSDLPHGMMRELRFYPYFFPDVFKDGGNPAEESQNNWMKIRRALLRKPVDRIGWGGYLSLAAKFPEFIEHLTGITDEFREFHDKTNGSEAWIAPIKVGVLNAWGSLRSWMVQAGPIEKFYSGREDVMEFVGTNLTECLAGLPVDVTFLSFTDILNNPACLDELDVIINEGVMGSAWSGGEVWKDPKVVLAIRKWTHDGGGLIGVGHPSAIEYAGKVFQLSDLLGIDLELGKGIQVGEQGYHRDAKHFIAADLQEKDFRTVTEHSYAFSSNDETVVLDMREKHVHLACKATDAGRGVYISSLPFDWQNARLLHRAIFWAAGKEEYFKQCHSSNPNTDAAWYPATQVFCAVNNTGEPQETTLFDSRGKQLQTVVLEPRQVKYQNVIPREEI